ncbi:hypothetical protein H072_6576 [Dactylellina haptotyla CBS 200.50]|uniref:Reverse transcriptase domain-containing protein n=1 Tax=Dactylellina haptotyla (strain CBS 200.50) TaxID=1284197 RepID=S8A9D7_DACHA|nr:hypothetical protein H072_6576 [Dactylellina haptotyla CBS 200.50]
MDNTKTFTEVNAIADTRNLVTAVKLRELYLKKKELEDLILPILERLEKAPTEKEKVEILIEENKKKDSILQHTVFDSYGNAPDILAMSENDPAISDQVFKPQRVHGESALRKREFESFGFTVFQKANRDHYEELRKWQYTSLFGSIFNEWMNFEGKADLPDDDADGVKTPRSDDESTVNVAGSMNRPEKYIQKAELEGIIFTANPIAKPEEYIKYLEKLFEEVAEEGKAKAKKPSLRLDSEDEDDDGEDEDQAQAGSLEDDDDDYNYLEAWGGQLPTLKRLRNTIGRFSGSFRKHTSLARVDVKQSIHGLVSGELLTEAKKAACKEILLSDVILDEIAMVLTLRLREIENWKYSEPSVQLNFRRHLNGKYRCYADESLLDAIFLQWIGVKWGIELRRVLGIVHRSAAWYRPENLIDAARQEVRSTMLPLEEEKAASNSIDMQRKSFMKEFFLTLLPESLYDFRTYNEDGDAVDQEKKENDKLRRARNEELKQMLLQRLLIDRQYSDAISPGKTFTVVQADAFRFAQSQSHEIILALMKFIGVTNHWLAFFKSFLKLPARFEVGGEVRESKRGVPISHPLGLVFGEVQLFLMEFAVNRATKGNLGVFRMHDDFWWWGADEKQCEKAWETINEYSALAGTEWNLDKSGCVRMISPSAEADTTVSSSTLPTGEISWGFIKLGTDGIWKVKQDEVEKHIQEMKLQMDSQKSILGVISAYNRYMKFFVRNFGKPARAFGKQHVEQIIAAINKIHSALFPDHNGDVLAYVTSLVNSRFGEELAEPLVPAWLYIPVANGGLGVRNPFFDIYPILQSYKIEEETYERERKYGAFYTPHNFKQCLKKDKKEYEIARDQWLKKPKPAKVAWEQDVSDDWFDGMKEYLASREASRSSRHRRKPHPFITFDEFILGRRAKFTYWGDVWKGLSETPDQTFRYRFPEVITKGLSSSGWSSTDWLKSDYAKTTPYWRSWLLSFGEQVLDIFGGFYIVGEGRLPTAMIDIYTNQKTKWDQ